MDLLFYSLFLVSAAIGTGSSFISDVFFVFSFKNHTIKINELKILSRLQFAGIICAIIALLSRIILLALQVEVNIYIHEGLQYLMMLILGIILIATLTIRRFHLPALLRHQQQYSHLSDSFKEHHDGLITTSALNLISWIYVILLTAFESHNLYTSIGFISAFFVYIVLAVATTQIAQQIKGFYKGF